jgi:hypothetical protein
METHTVLIVNKGLSVGFNLGDGRTGSEPISLHGYSKKATIAYLIEHFNLDTNKIEVLNDC